MTNLTSQRPLDRCSTEIQFMILDYLPDWAVRDFLYTCKDYFNHFLRYFVTRRTDNGLIYAANNKDRHLLRLTLLIKDVDVNMEDQSGKTALFWAAYRSDEVMVRALATHPNIDTQKPVRYAISRHQLEVVEIILQFGAVSLDATDYPDRTVLHEALMLGALDIAELLACRAQPLDFERIDRERKTPLHWAIKHGYDEVIDMYFSKRYAWSNSHTLENGLLRHAIRYHRELIALKILRLQGFKLVVSPQDEHPIHLAFRERLELVVAELRLQILDDSSTNNDNWNTTRHALRANNEAIAFRLLDSGVSLPADESILWATAQGAEYETFRLLLLHEGYGPVFPNSTCLQYAIRGREERIIKTVLRMTTSIDCNVILAAVESDMPEVLLQVLKHFGITMTPVDLGDLLFHAIQYGAILATKALLGKLHADPCYFTDGRTALLYAAKMGRVDIISVSRPSPPGLAAPTTPLSCASLLLTSRIRTPRPRAPCCSFSLLIYLLYTPFPALPYPRLSFALYISLRGL